MKIWLFSDTHGKHGQLVLPDVDMAIFAGDCGTMREPYENANVVDDFLTWYHDLPYKYKVFVPGNHDTSIERGLVDFNKYPSIHCLNHVGAEIGGLHLFGSPYTPSFGHGWAYNVKREHLAGYWDDIPHGLDFLITHGPPKGILDYTQSDSASTVTSERHFVQCGCKSLLNSVRNKKPKYHVFGHIHTESNCPNAGVFKPTNSDTTFINASVLDLRYQLNNNGVVVEI